MLLHEIAFAILALVGASCAPLHAKAVFHSEDQLVERADAIAVIKLDAPVACRIESTIWTCQQMAKARIVEPIAGKLPTNLTLHGDESFICGQCPLAKGRSLAFLTKIDTLWCRNQLAPLPATDPGWPNRVIFPSEVSPRTEVSGPQDGPQSRAQTAKRVGNGSFQ